MRASFTFYYNKTRKNSAEFAGVTTKGGTAFAMAGHVPAMFVACSSVPCGQERFKLAPDLAVGYGQPTTFDVTEFVKSVKGPYFGILLGDGESQRLNTQLSTPNHKKRHGIRCHRQNEFEPFARFRAACPSAGFSF